MASDCAAVEAGGPLSAMQCRACYHHLIDKARFCDECGTATAPAVMESEGLMSYCGRCSALLRGVKKHCIYCGEPSPHSPKYRRRREVGPLERLLMNPKAQAAIVGALLIAAALPIITPIRYTLSSAPPFVGVRWGGEEESAAPQRAALPRRDVYSVEPLLEQLQAGVAGLNLLSAGGVARDTQGNLYVSDTVAHKVYRISATGERSVVAGNGSAGFSGDGGAAEDAALHTPRGLAIDSDNNLFIADAGNNRVRRVNARGIIRTIAGGGGAAKSKDPAARFFDAEKAPLLSPALVQPDQDGNLFVTESGCESGERTPTVWVLKQKM